MDAETVDDRELVRRAQAELPYRTGAYEALMRRHGPRIVGVCRFWVGNAADAEDLAQEIYLKVFFQLPAFRGDSALTTWLWRLTVNHCIDFVRKRQRQGTVTALPVEAAAGDGARQAEEMAEARRLLARLPDEERALLVLRFYAGLSFEEIAEALGIGLSAAKMRYQRVVERLRELVNATVERSG
jgi:RNA polymerase sigma-70 factor (ECF subfamily)